MPKYKIYLRVDPKYGFNVFTNGSDHVLWGGEWYQTYPGVSRDIGKAWERNGFRYREVMDGSFHFMNKTQNDYTILSQIESPSVDVQMRIEHECATSASDWWLGYFSITDGEWDADRGLFVVTPLPDDDYKLLEAYRDQQHNLISLLSPSVQASIEYPVTTTIIESPCLACDLYGGCAAVWDSGCVETWAEAFKLANTTFPSNETGDTTDTWDKFLFYDYDPCSGIEWSVRWFKQTAPIKVNENWVYDEANNNYYRTAGNASGSIDLNARGMLLTDAIEAVIQSIDSNLEYESNFFQDDENYVTGTNPNPLKHLVLYQKSDIKTTTDPATKGLVSFGELMTLLSDMFNVDWFIDDDGKFRIEHYSYFAKTVDVDLTADYTDYVKYKNKYSYDRQNMPSREHFEWMESSGEDFIGLDIVYDMAATGNKYRDSQKDRVLRVTTDMPYAWGNQGEISNEGWVMLSCGSDYVINNEVGVLSGESQINGHLSWANLHDAYWKHGRVISTGNMNGVATNFSDWQKTIRQVEITYPDSEFDPNYLKTTFLGDGEVFEAKYRLIDGAVSTVFFYPDIKTPLPPPEESYLIKITGVYLLLKDTDEFVEWRS